MLKDKDGNEVDVELSAATTDDFDGKRGIIVNAILHGRVDNDTTVPIACDASGNVKIVIA